MSRAFLALASVALLTACRPAEPPVAAPCPPAPPLASAIAVDAKPGPTGGERPPEPRRDPRDPNPAGTTLIPSSVFVDPSPPEGWTQCAGFVNTKEDDVTADFVDNCLNADRLRVRVFDARGKLEEDVYVTGIVDLVTWSGNYLGAKSTVVKATHWGTKSGVPSVLTSNLSECFPADWPEGTTLGSGHAETAIISGAADGYHEYRISCGANRGLADRKIAVYR